MSDMTREDVERLRRLAEEATPGPWYWDEGELLAADGDPICVGAMPQGRAEQQDEANDAYLSSLDPSTVQALCDLAEEALRWREDPRAARHAELDRWAKANGVGHVSGALDTDGTD